VATPGPHIVILAGPNGAGKSTTAPRLLKGALGVAEFVNADTIAQGLSAFAPEEAALLAGRIMLERARDLAERRVDFAFETTLASRSLVAGIRQLCDVGGYRVHLLFLWLSDAETAVARVRERVRAGGHNVPEETIRRRYDRGLQNFIALYQPLVTTWRVYDNSREAGPSLVASGGRRLQVRVRDAATWARVLEAAKNA
jgi:predicted ABC-type ATPase